MMTDFQRAYAIERFRELAIGLLDAAEVWVRARTRDSEAALQSACESIQRHRDTYGALGHPGEAMESAETRLVDGAQGVLRDPELSRAGEGYFAAVGLARSGLRPLLGLSEVRS